MRRGLRESFLAVSTVVFIGLLVALALSVGPAHALTPDERLASTTATEVNDPGVVSVLASVPTTNSAAPGGAASERPTRQGGSVLSDHLLVTWYGNPRTGLMGVLGQYDGADLAARLQRQADAYQPYTDKTVLPAYELIAIVAMDNPGDDGKWRRQETPEVIDAMLAEARANGFKLILDVQVGHSKASEELEYLRPWLEQPDVYLALDPEFDMWEGQVPGVEIGHTVSGDVNYALGFLDRIINENGLPPKVLIVHQFTENMLPDKGNIGGSSVVDVVLDMDGFGAQWLKNDTWNMVMAQPLEFSGIKLFYDQDPGMFTPEEVMALQPTPSVVIYQ